MEVRAKTVTLSAFVGMVALPTELQRIYDHPAGRQTSDSLGGPSRIEFSATEVFMPDALGLSNAGLDLLKLHVEQQGHIRVDDSNREAHRELARAGILYPLSGFAAGPESHYRFTELGWINRGKCLSGQH